MAVIRPAQLFSLKFDLRDDKPTYTRVYHVYTELTDHQDTALGASGIPAYGSMYSFNGFIDPLAFALDFSTEMSESNWVTADDGSGDKWMRWPVTVVNRYFDSNKKDPPDRNPLNEPPEISGSFNSVHFLDVKDSNNKLLANTAGDLIDPLPQGEEFIDTVNIKYNSATIDLGLRASVKGTVNSGAFWGLSKRQIKLAKWAYQVRYYGNNAYISNNIECEISFKKHPATVDGKPAVVGFYDTFPNRGWKQLINGAKLRILDDHKVPLTDQSYLDINGARSDNESYVRFERESESNFSSFLPNPLPGPFV